MSDERDGARDPNRLIERVDALMKRQQEDTQRAVEEVPVLTEVVDARCRAATPPSAAR